MTARIAGGLVLAPHGPPARGELADIIAATKGGDPLAPVSVAVPSTYAGLSLRREAGRRPGGLVNVRFLPLHRIAELLGAPVLAEQDRRPLTPVLRAGAVRAVLALEPGPFAGVATHPGTERALVETLGELAAVTDEALDRVAAAGARGRAVVALVRRFRSVVTPFYDDERQLLAAADLVVAGAAGAAALDDLGTIVVFLPRVLTAGGISFVRALAMVGRVRVILGLTGDEAADRTAHTLASVLAPMLGPPVTTTPVRSSPAGSVIVSCPDPDEEARAVVRRIFERLEHGTPLHRIAVAYRAARPYARLLHEHLGAAGIPVHGPAPRTLAESVAGRALLGLLHVADRGLSRAEVMALLADVPILERAGGPVVPAARWDRLSREANVIAGLDQWRERLARHRDTCLAAVARRAADEGSTFAGDETEGDLAHLDRIEAFVEGLAQWCTPPPNGTWRVMAAFAADLLDRYVDPPAHLSSQWPSGELAALDEVRRALHDLSALDTLGSALSTVAFTRALEAELDTPVGHVGRFGDGVLVAPVGALVGTDYETLFVVGMTEGSFPPPTRDDPLLPDAARAVAGADLPRRSARAGAERVDYLAALCAASERVLCFPRADPRAQRAARPAHFVLETASRHAGRPVMASDLEPNRATGHAWLHVVPSFAAAVSATGPPASAQEHDVRSLLAWRAQGHSLARHPLCKEHGELAQGFAAIRARAARALGPWEGIVGPMPGIGPDTQRALSPTSLEVWAHCPFKYLLERVLRLREVERPEARDRISPLVRGSMLHAALAAFVHEHPRTASDQRWTPEERARLRLLGSELCDRAEADGITGRPALWRLDRARILRDLDSVLDTDEWLRATTGAVTIGTELGFGAQDDPLPPLHLDVDGEPVSFRGRIDRVDRTPDGRRVLVFDYKTGSAEDYAGLDDDPVLGGRRLQLALYALALREAFPDTRIGANYWFTRERGAASVRGFDLDTAGVEERSLETIDAIVGSVRAGNFPAYPGAEGWFRPENCKWCAFHRLCPTDRVRRLERRRDDPSLATVLCLREGEPGADAEGDE